MTSSARRSLHTNPATTVILKGKLGNRGSPLNPPDALLSLIQTVQSTALSHMCASTLMLRTSREASIWLFNAHTRKQ